jgi:hypothetical protein
VTKPAPSIARRIASWVVLLLFVAILVWAFAVYASSFIDMPPWMAAIAGLALLVGIVGYILGREAVYKKFCDPLGYHCELRPVKSPRSARDAVELVISGKFRGRSFTLYRETAASTSVFQGGGAKTTALAVLEWTGDDIRFPKFTQYLDLATKTVSDKPDPRAAQGTVEAEPGLLVIRQLPKPKQELWDRQGRFPLPWDIEEFLNHGDEIRRVFMP